MKNKRLVLLPLAAALLVAAGAAWYHSRFALWRIVDTGCVAAARAGRPSKCVQVVPAHDATAGYAVLKDRRGVLQYLLIPTQRVTGIEDPALRETAAADYLPAAWRARRWLDIAHQAPVPREDVAIALNSAWSRSQDQFHVHISCVRPDLKARLQALDGRIGNTWGALAGGWQGHPYQVRRLDADTLDGTDLLRELAAAHPDDMGRQAVAAVGATLAGHPGFWLLETQVSLGAAWLAGIEGDVQDHTCAVLAESARP